MKVRSVCLDESAMKSHTAVGNAGTGKARAGTGCLGRTGKRRKAQAFRETDLPKPLLRNGEILELL
jgi:hypothetical protein